MTDEDKKKMIAGFSRDMNLREDDFSDDPWDEEALLKTAEKILERIKRDEEMGI